MKLKDEIFAKCPADLIESKDYWKIAQLVSAGRTKIAPCKVDELTVRGALSPALGGQLLLVLRGLESADLAGTTPDWLTPILAEMGVPDSQVPYYVNTLGCAYGALRSKQMDLGDPTTRNMLGLIAVGVPELSPAAQILKEMAVVPDPVTQSQVIDALTE